MFYINAKINYTLGEKCHAIASFGGERIFANRTIAYRISKSGIKETPATSALVLIVDVVTESIALNKHSFPPTRTWSASTL